MGRLGFARLSTKLGLFSSLLVLVTVGGLSAVFFMFQSASYRAEAISSRVAYLRGLAEVSKEVLRSGEDSGLAGYLRLMRARRGLAYAAVVLPSGKIMAHTDPKMVGKVAADPGWVVALNAEKPSVHNYRAASGEDIMDFTYPIEGGEAGAVVRTGYRLAVLEEMLWENLRRPGMRIAQAAGAALLLGIAAALFMAQRITRPIREMASAAGRIGEGRLETKVEVRTSDELGDLAREINSMAARLEELDRLKKDFASSVTHELRSPLNAIGIYFDLFFQGRLGPVDEKQLDALRVMQSSAAQLRGFVDDLLDAASLERGKFEVKPRPVAVRSLIEDVLKLFRPAAEKGGLELKESLEEPLPKVLADPERTKQVVTNLLSNALKFAPKGGAVSVTASLGKGGVEVRVHNTGEGLPAEDLERIFEKFERAARAVGKIRGGAGLGLAIAKGIVEAQGGAIHVESTLGKGTAFTFTLPVAGESEGGEGPGKEGGIDGEA